MDPDYEALTEALNVDRDRLHRRADFAAWRAERKKEEFEVRGESLSEVEHVAASHEVASAYARAASYWSLIHLERAMYLYQEATRHYRSARRLFANVTGICAGASEIVRFWAEEEATEVPNVDRSPEAAVQYLMGLTFAECLTLRRSDVVDSIIDFFSERERDTRMIGRLRIPIELYVWLIRASRGAAFATGAEPEVNVETDAEYQAREVQALAGAFEGFLLRADELVGRAISDGYHWSRCLTSLLPAEPELVAMATLSFTAALRRGLDRELRERLVARLPERARVPLELGHSIAAAMTVGA
jgi:hypothetical protein